MRTSMAMVFSCVLFFSGAACSESLEFLKSTVDAYKEGSTSVKAMMIMADKTQHPTQVQLPVHIHLKNITKGHLVFVKKRKEVFEVLNVHTDVNGSNKMEIKSTGLYIGKIKNKRKTRVH